MCLMGHMAAYDTDPDVVRWGLHLLDVCTLSNSGSPSIITQYDTNLSQIQYVREGFCQPTYVENDEAVARAYQEELSQLDSIEASGRSNFDNEHLRESVLAQDWISSNGNYNNGNQSCQNTVDEPNNMKEMENYAPSERDNNVNEIGVFGSSSESGEIPVTSDDFWHSLEISDESSLDGEVGKRLNQMIPIPHIPKTNENIPSYDEEISDHERLLDRLQLYDVIERKVEGDGNCQFRSLSDQLYRSPEHHKFVREQIIQQLKSFPDLYSGYVPMAYGDYLKKMSKSGEWGDHVTLQAAADWLGELKLGELLDTPPPGLDEAIAISKVIQFLESQEYSMFTRIVFDTAPTGHTLRLLSLPDFLDASIGKILKLRQKIASATSAIKSVFGQEGTPQNAADKLEKLRERMIKVRELFRDTDSTEFVIVTIPTVMAVSESSRLSASLKKENVPLKRLVVNQLLPPSASDCKFCAMKRKDQMRALDMIQNDSELSSLLMIQAPLVDVEIRGVPALKFLGDIVWK